VRILRAALVLVVLLIAAVWIYAKLTSDDTSTSQTFGDSLRTFPASASTKVRLSPDATRLAFVQDGALSIVRIRDGAILTRAGTNIVDAAWMPDGSRVLIDEGPIPTGQVAVINGNGRVAGVAHLKPSIGFGNGAGLSVNDDGTKAAAIAVSRDAIGGKAHNDLAVIDLQSGAVRVYATPEQDEDTPVFVDDDTIAVASLSSKGAAHLHVVAIATGEVRDLGAIDAGPFVTTTAGEVVVSRSALGESTDLIAVDATTAKDRLLANLKPGRRPLTVDSHTTRVVVRVSEDGQAERIAVDPIT
jgi:hypothetical protein